LHGKSRNTTNKTPIDEKNFVIRTGALYGSAAIFFLRCKQKRNRLPDDGEYRALKARTFK
jgi:hypothetical protein